MFGSLYLPQTGQGLEAFQEGVVDAMSLFLQVPTMFDSARWLVGLDGQTDMTAEDRQDIKEEEGKGS